jgi:large subunit ribosomal protein L2
MAVIKMKPTSPGQRAVVKISRDHLHKGEAYAPLLEPQFQKAGRNNNGHITTRHKGGGHKHHYRVVDFRRNKDGVPAKVERIEYDPNRNCRIALLFYKDGEKRYILATEGMREGQEVMSAENAPVKPGNRAKVKNIPIGTTICNLELFPGRGGQIIRSAGSSASLTAVDEKTAQIKMPSGEIRTFLENCMATIGQIGNLDHGNATLGKAGRSRGGR